MKKVIHIITRMDMGGSAQNTLLTCFGIKNEKYDVVLVYGPSFESNMTELEESTVKRNIEKAIRNGVKTIVISSMVRRIDPVKDVFTFISLLKIFWKEKPDIVHTHTSKAGILGRLAAVITAKAVIIHTTHGHVFYGHFGPFVSRVFLLIEKIFARMTDKMIALTEGEKKDFIDYYVCGPQKIITIHSGVDIDKFKNIATDINKKKQELGIENCRFIVGTVGWLLPIKGSMILLNSMVNVIEKYPEVQLIYIGKGGLEKDLRKKIRASGMVENVKLLGWRQDIEEIMQILDIFVLPSLMEGMGRVLVEAMAAGKPVVASRTGGIPDLVKHEENGLLVPPGNENELTQAILRLIENQDIASAFGRRGRELSHNFSIKAMNNKIEQLYTELLYHKRSLES